MHTWHEHITPVKASTEQLYPCQGEGAITHEQNKSQFGGVKTEAVLYTPYLEKIWRNNRA